MERTILVVDDNRAVNNQVADMLGRGGFQCLQAFDGLEALKCFNDCRPDAVVLDLNLPKIHGLEVLRYIKQERPEAVALVLTGHSSQQAAVRALRLGADDYLAKPLREDRLKESLQRALDRADRERMAASSRPPRPILSDRKVAQAFFGAPVPLLFVDGRGCVHLANRAAGRFLGRRLDQLLGLPVGELLEESVRDSWFAAVCRETRDGRSFEGEVHFAGVSGEPIPAGFSAAEAPEGNGLLLSLRDLERQKALEKQFLETKRLSSLGRVVEGVAHEVRNPVIAIGGFARKLLRDAADGDGRRQYLEVILSEAQRLERMVREIEAYVDFSARRRPKFSPVDLAGISRRSLEGRRGRAAGLGVDLSLDAPEEFPTLFGDAELLAELLEVLVDNALDAMPKGGKVLVALEAAGNWVRLRVADTGVGIPEAALEDIFDPFFTTKTSGAGLGLAKGHMIVEDHSGMIEFESQPGQGTACTVTLPVDRRRIPRGLR